MHVIQMNLESGKISKIPYTQEQVTEWNLNRAIWLAGGNDRACAEVRATRNVKIASCDWRMLADVLSGDVWKTYRQALRDVPAQVGFPENVIWPAEPWHK